MRLKEAEMAILIDLWADGNPAYEHLKTGCCFRAVFDDSIE
jgi:hypothetical protein